MSAGNIFRGQQQVCSITCSPDGSVVCLQAEAVACVEPLVLQGLMRTGSYFGTRILRRPAPRRCKGMRAVCISGSASLYEQSSPAHTRAAATRAKGIATIHIATTRTVECVSEIHIRAHACHGVMH